jgi:hypothetical protein
VVCVCVCVGLGLGRRVLVRLSVVEATGLPTIAEGQAGKEDYSGVSTGQSLHIPSVSGVRGREGGTQASPALTCGWRVEASMAQSIDNTTTFDPRKLI